MPAAILLSVQPLTGKKPRKQGIVYDKLWLADSVPVNKS